MAGGAGFSISLRFVKKLESCIEKDRKNLRVDHRKLKAPTEPGKQKDNRADKREG